MLGMIMHEDTPCWYELSWRGGEEPGIVLRVHTDFIRDQPPIPAGSGIGQEFMAFGFTRFVPTIADGFGFDGAARYVGGKDGFVELLLPLRNLRRETGTCRDCGGTGKDEDDGETCITCGGAGKDYDIEWQSAYAASATLTVLFNWMRYPEKPTSAPFPQLISAWTTTVRDMHGGSLGGMFSIPLVQWLRKRWRTGSEEIPAMVKAMRGAHERMLGQNKFDSRRDFMAQINGESGWLNVSCPGQACGLNPAHEPRGDGFGYDFSPHNVDSPMQQLTLLAGLAALHDAARKDIK